ncbi:MAG: poly-gamma-glutamate hydrolase family protein, partial [Acidimicrobiales bacterium]
AELLSMDGVREESVLRGTFGFMAFHGGDLEEVTDTIARTAAERAGASYYGVLLPDRLEWHIPSRMVTADQSPALASFLSHVEIVVTVHGYGRAGFFTSLLLGGGNRRLAAHLGTLLRRHLPAYDIIDDIDAIPRDLRGLHQNNPVNVPLHSGVQLELPPRVRGASPMFWDWEGPEPAPHTQRLIDALVECAQTWQG